VSLAVSGGSLSLVGVTTNPGCSVSEKQTTCTTVQNKFVNGGETVEFEAELDGGVVKTQASSSGSDG
jgi:hypothetical protein